MEGGYFGRLDGSHAKGSLVKNCTHKPEVFFSSNHELTIYNQTIERFGEEGWLTSLLKAEVEVPRSTGSMARSVSTRCTVDGSKPLNASATQRLYGCWGLKRVAFANLYFFQYNSEGEPHNLNIL